MNEDYIKDTITAAEEALRSVQPLKVIQLSGEVGLVWAHLKRVAADKEAGRKELQQDIQQELMDGGMNKTSAEPASRADERYVTFLTDLAGMSENRDRAEVLWKCLRTRARLLGGEDAD